MSTILCFSVNMGCCVYINEEKDDLNDFSKWLQYNKEWKIKGVWILSVPTVYENSMSTRKALKLYLLITYSVLCIWFDLIVHHICFLFSHNCVRSLPPRRKKSLTNCFTVEHNFQQSLAQSVHTWISKSRSSGSPDTYRQLCLNRFDTKLCSKLHRHEQDWALLQ